MDAAYPRGSPYCRVEKLRPKAPERRGERTQVIAAGVTILQLLRFDTNLSGLVGMGLTIVRATALRIWLNVVGVRSTAHIVRPQANINSLTIIWIVCRLRVILHTAFQDIPSLERDASEDPRRTQQTLDVCLSFLPASAAAPADLGRQKWAGRARTPRPAPQPPTFFGRIWANCLTEGDAQPHAFPVRPHPNALESGASSFDARSIFDCRS